jgi:hypothetical protein
MSANPPAWIAQLVKLLRPLIPNAFVGQIEVNRFMGGITNVNVRQSYKLPNHEKEHEDFK